VVRCVICDIWLCSVFWRCRRLIRQLKCGLELASAWVPATATGGRPRFASGAITGTTPMPARPMVITVRSGSQMGCSLAPARGSVAGGAQAGTGAVTGAVEAGAGVDADIGVDAAGVVAGTVPAPLAEVDSLTGEVQAFMAAGSTAAAASMAGEVSMVAVASTVVVVTAAVASPIGREL